MLREVSTTERATGGDQEVSRLRPFLEVVHFGRDDDLLQVLKRVGPKQRHDILEIATRAAGLRHRLLDQSRRHETRYVDPHDDIRVRPRHVEQGRIGRAQRQQGGQEKKNGADALWRRASE